MSAPHISKNPTLPPVKNKGGLNLITIQIAETPSTRGTYFFMLVRGVLYYFLCILEQTAQHNFSNTSIDAPEATNL